MGRNGHQPPEQIKNPDWSWVFKVGNDGELNAISILNDKYENQKMEFAKKSNLVKVILVNDGKQTEIDINNSEFTKVGTDDITGLPKYLKNGRA